MSEKKIISKEELSKVKYGELLNKFTELGIPEVWKAGTKKITMINSAIDKLKIKTNLESLGLEDAEVSKELEVIVENKIKADLAKEVEVAKQVEIKDKAETKQIQNSGLTKEQVEGNLRNIELNLKNGIESHRIVLLKKQADLELLLSKF